MKDHSKVQLSAINRSARITVPEAVGEEIEKLDQHVYKGQTINISRFHEPIAGNNITTTAGGDQSINCEDISHMEIDTRIPKWSRNKVTAIEIIRALELNHSDDFTKSVEPLRRELIGIFRLDSADYSRYVHPPPSPI